MSEVAEKKITPKQPKEADSSKDETKAATRVTKKKVQRKNVKRTYRLR